MILQFIGRLFTFFSNIQINKGNRLLFHRYDMISLALFFGAVVLWLDPNLRHWFDLLRFDLAWYKTVGIGMILYPIMITGFHAYLHGKKLEFWYCGDGHGNIFEDLVRIANCADYEEDPKGYTRTSIYIRGLFFIEGVILLLI